MILLPIHLVEVSVLKIQFTTVLGQVILEHELTSHKQMSWSSVITEQICIGEEEDVGPMLLYLRHLCSLIPESFCDLISFFFPPGELWQIIHLISSDLDLYVKMKAI